MRIACINYFTKKESKKLKGKVLGDSESDLSDEYEDECCKYMIFIAKTNEVIVESNNGSEDFFYDEIPKKLTLQEACDKLCTEYE